MNQLNNFLMYYEKKLYLFVTKLESNFRKRLQSISKRNMVLGVAVAGIVVIAVINHTTKLESNLENPTYLFKRGSEYYLKENYDKAIEDYTAALKIKPNNPNLLWARGSSYLQKKEFYKAIADLTTALLLKPNDPGCLFNRGTAYLLQENYDKAVADFETLLQIQPYNTEARGLLELAREKIAASR